MATKQKLLVKSKSFGRLSVDAVISTDHQANLTLTEHPVQQGAPVSDHAYMNPDEVSVEIGMTDVMEGSGADHSVNAYNTFRALMEKREPVTVVTRLKTYEDMMITTISSLDDHTTMHALRATIYFTKVNIVDVSTVKVQGSTSGSKKKTSTGSKGSTAKTGTQTKTTKATKSTEGTKKQSVLKQIFGK